MVHKAWGQARMQHGGTRSQGRRAQPASQRDNMQQPKGRLEGASPSASALAGWEAARAASTHPPRP